MFYVEIFSNEKYFMSKQTKAKSIFSSQEGEFLGAHSVVINSIPLLSFSFLIKILAISYI